MGGILAILQRLLLIFVISSVSVNSEANARRIAMVENCFGSSGQVSGRRDESGMQISSMDSQRLSLLVKLHITSYSNIDDSLVSVLFLLIATRGTRQGSGGRRCPDKNVQEEAKAETVLPV